MSAHPVAQDGVYRLERVVPRHKQSVVFRWIKRDWMIFGAFKAARERMGLGVYGHCFWCKQPFAEIDMMALAQPEKGANRVLCQVCANAAVKP